MGGTAASLLLHPTTNTTEGDVLLGGTPIEDVLAGSRMEALTAVATAIEAMPDDVVAHRMGDYVFTYHGVRIGTWTANAQQLWTVVMLPDPDTNPNLAPDTLVEMATADYMVTTTTLGELPALIDAQNDLRKAAGLGPLPADLHLVRHDEPVGPAVDGD